MKSLFFMLTLAFTSIAMAQPYDDDPARDERIKKMVTATDVSKCPDGSAKEVLNMGLLKNRVDAVYIAKSNNQDFVVITPRPEGSVVNLYYCPAKKIIWQNGKQTSENIPVENYRFDLGQLNKRENCEFSDIQSGVIQVRYKGIAYPAIFNVRPIIGSAAEETEYKKLCSDKIKKKTSKVGDSASAQ